MSVKILLSNKSALQAKYGNNVGVVLAAIPTLVASDRARNIITTVIFMDDPVQMAQYNAPPITTVNSAQQTKAAIDALVNATNPNYITLFGAPDIVTMVPLNNPTTDGDPNVPSDLPYACSAPYSLNAANFTAPTRIVGRLPDITGQPDANYLPRLIQFYISIRPQPRASYLSYLGITCAVWQGSTSLSLNAIFGNSAAMQQSPPQGPYWNNGQYANLAHFVNCHGSSNDPVWYGQQGTNYPQAMIATALNQKLVQGTIATAECCYGAQLYNPAPPGGANYGLSLCNTYLQSGAVSFFGSTNIAYGPANSNGAADLITQYFMINMLGGAMAGAATLQARQTFVSNAGGALSPTDLKTLAQFFLLGDSTAAPVAPPPAPAIDPDVVPGAADAKAPRSEEFRRFVAAAGDARANAERFRARAIGEMLEATTAVPVASAEPASGEAADVIERIIASRRLPSPVVRSYDVRLPLRASAALERAIAPRTRFHEVRSVTDTSPNGSVVNEVVYVIRESAGQVVAIEELYRH